jgi:transposase
MLPTLRRQDGFFGDFIYDQVIPADHSLRRLRSSVDFDFIDTLCKDLYSETGRPAWEPSILFRMLLLQTLYDIPSKDISEQVTFHLAYKWFVGLEVVDRAPDAGTLASFRERLGPERFGEIYNIVAEKGRAGEAAFPGPDQARPAWPKALERRPPRRLSLGRRIGDLASGLLQGALRLLGRKKDPQRQFDFMQ